MENSELRGIRSYPPSSRALDCREFLANTGQKSSGDATSEQLTIARTSRPFHPIAIGMVSKTRAVLASAEARMACSTTSLLIGSIGR